MLLQVLIATYGDKGLRRTASMSLPVIDGVSYLVSCQTGEDAAPTVPADLQRPDIRVIMTQGRGLCANRNRLLEAADAEYVLTADDDMSYTEAQLRAALDNLGEADITTFRIEGAGDKSYPKSRLSLVHGMPRGYCPSSVEIALRMEAVRRSGLHFCTLFGIGAPALGCGEEDILIWNARRLGLSIEYIRHRASYGRTVHRSTHADPGSMARSRRSATPYTSVQRMAAYSSTGNARSKPWGTAPDDCRSRIRRPPPLPNRNIIQLSGHNGRITILRRHLHRRCCRHPSYRLIYHHRRYQIRRLRQSPWARAWLSYRLYYASSCS